MDNNGGFETQAAAQVERLREVYRAYTESSKDQPRPYKGMARLLKGWFSGFNPSAAEPLHQEFLDDVEDIITKLDSVLDKLSELKPDKSSSYALEAAAVMLSPKPVLEKTTAQWYMTIAEYKSTAILPYLERDDLKAIRDAQLNTTPKRLMYPRQRELFEYMERLLSDSE